MGGREGADGVVDPDSPSGVGRRTLIKRAAAAGAVAWTAPIIMDSLLSPAAALTVTPVACANGCQRFGFDAVASGTAKTTTVTEPFASLKNTTCPPVPPTTPKVACPTSADVKTNGTLAGEGATSTNNGSIDMAVNNSATGTVVTFGNMGRCGSGQTAKLIAATLTYNKGANCAKADYLGNNTDNALGSANVRIDSLANSVTFKWNGVAGGLKSGSGSFAFLIGCGCA